MEIRVLGPLEVLHRGQALELGGAKQRTVLALLALHANESVSLERLVDALWEDEAPGTARKAVQVYVSQLRKLLGRDRVETTGAGYRLRLETDELDLARFERLRDEGEVEAALSLWRGEPLADLADHRFAREQAARLDELRLSCLEQRFDRDLAAGRGSELAPELEALVCSHPHRERLRAQLMLALYRGGRQAEALEAYQTARSALVDELGLEPGRALRELHRRILQQDPALDPPTAPPRQSPRPPAERASAIRKTVTVLFCDVAGSTELGERLDPEALRAVMAQWFDAMRAPLERAGGTVEKFVGDAVMAVFGVPVAHEDDAFRAVQAAVEMRSAADGLRIPVRIGVNTGEVVTGDGATTLVTGDAVNTAKRLEEAAAPGEILIGATTRRLVENAAELEPAGPVSAKGKRGPVEASRVRGVVPGAPPFARRLDAPLVGRTGELRLLQAELDEVAHARACRLVTVVGPAGVGKSRLAQELLGRVGARARVLTARCVPYGDGITVLPLRELLAETGSEDVLAAASAEETFWAVRRLLEELAAERPLVVRLEDLHWAQPTFLDLLEYMVGWSRDAPILLLCLARPELLEERPRWPGTTVVVDALSGADSDALLDALASEWPIGPEARMRIADAAEGNPLFLEQLVAMVAEQGVADAVPPTIQALLAARLDRLEPLERAVLQRAAVAGRDFSRAAVADLSPDDERARVGATLLSLVRKELVRPEHSAFAGDDGFRFRHALIRDAAYAEVPKRTRAELHERFASRLEVRDATPALAGYHLEQAYRCRAELGEDDPALGARAGTLLADAGERAFARDDGPAAANLLLRAHALLGRGDPRQPAVMRLAALALWWAGDVEEARMLLQEQIRRAAAVGDVEEEWSGRLDLAADDLVTGRIDPDELLVVARRAIGAFGPDDDAGLARAWRRVAHAHFAKGAYGATVEAAERALAHARAAGDRFQEGRIADLLCTSLLYGPTPAGEAVGRCEHMLAEAHANQVMSANIAAALAGLLAMRGEHARARGHARDAETVYLELGLQLAFAGLTQVTGPMELLAGDPAAAERELLRGLEILEPQGADGYQRALLAEALYRQDRLDEAGEHARLAEERSPADNVQAQVAWRSVRAKLEGSEQLAHEAVALAEETDAPNLLADALADLALVTTSDEARQRALELYARKGNTAGARRLSNIAAPL
jgi:class 3 adenylate cyclase